MPHPFHHLICTNTPGWPEPVGGESKNGGGGGCDKIPMKTGVGKGMSVTCSWHWPEAGDPAQVSVKSGAKRGSGSPEALCTPRRSRSPGASPWQLTHWPLSGLGAWTAKPGVSAELHPTQAWLFVSLLLAFPSSRFLFLCCKSCL